MAERQQQAGKPKNVRLPLMGAYSNRGSSPNKDQRFVNMFPETRKVEQLENTKIFINKRPGTSLYHSFGATGEGRGLAYFAGRFYAAIAGSLYSWDGVTQTTLLTLTGTTGHVGLLWANSSSIGDYLFVCDGALGWIVKSDNTVTAITDPDFPTPHIPVPTFIDGYVILAKANSVDVYNCDLDDPLGWTTSNYLSAEMFPDKVISLARQNNQIVVFGHNSIEFFYDAANASGSPLSRNDSTTIQMGTTMPYGLYQNEQMCAYVGASDSGGRAVWIISGFQPKKVSDEYIERILDAESNLEACRGYGLRTKGHLLYILNLISQNRTLVYDVDEKLWHEWSTNSTGNHSVFAGNYMADKSDGTPYLLHKSSGTIYKLDPNVNNDAGTSILCELVTNRYDMDTYNRKFMSSVKLVGDRYETANSVTLQWTNDDYETWSNEKTITLTDDFPAFHRLGSFRRRAFKIKHSVDQPLRVESLECVYTEGSS